MIKYFHKLTESEFKEILKTRNKNESCEEFANDYPKPEWCNYPDAVSPLGCWSLTGHLVTGEDYCKDCERYKKQEATNGTN